MSRKKRDGGNSGVSQRDFPINYLGISLHYKKLGREDLQPLVDKILKRMYGWRGKLLSHAGRIVLIKTCLASIPIYLMSFFKFPKWALKLINTHMANFLWNDYEGHGRIHLANWQLVSMKKEAGGLGIPDLRDLNLALLGSWVKRFIRDEGKLWHSVIRKKYMRNAPNIFCVPTTHSSTFWKGVIGNAKALKFGYKWSVGDGMQIRFWEDTWFGNSPLSVQFWDLYAICNQMGGRLAYIWDGQQVKLTFRRTFDDNMLEKWFELEEIVKSVVYKPGGDALVWVYNSNGIYSTSSLYTIINFRGVQPVDPDFGLVQYMENNYTLSDKICTKIKMHK